MKPEVFILDVDGVMTTGHFYYTENGKVMKCFGPDDHDGISLLAQHLEIRFITGDSKGFGISKKRIVDDMKFKLDLVSTVNRLQWISENFDPKKVIFMGDGIFDHYVFQSVKYGIAPHNADANAKRFASFVTERSGGDRAVAEACLHIMEKFFVPYDPLKNLNSSVSYSGQWGI